MISYETRAEADEVVCAGESVCATLLEDGSPRYFVMPIDVDDATMRAASFQVRYGRAMESFEETILSIAEMRAGV
jgi:hypothetical protein